MLVHFKPNTNWSRIVRELRNAGGYQLSDDYRLRIVHDEHIVLEVKGKSEWYNVFRIQMGHTTFCCGVSQLGQFAEHSQRMIDLPTEIGDKAFKLMTTYIRRMYNKGIIQCWFQKYPGDKDFYYPHLRKLFIRNGMKKFGTQTYNPNSGNRIIGYQGSLGKVGIDL
jgi:hypothetical protein